MFGKDMEWYSMYHKWKRIRDGGGKSGKLGKGQVTLNRDSEDRSYNSPPYVRGEENL